MSTLQNNSTTRKFRKADAVDVARMMRSLAAYHGDKSAAKPDTFAKHALGPSRLSHIWVAYEQGRCIGFIEGTYVIAYQAAQKILRINFIFVDEAFRQQGVGLALLRAAMAEALKQGCSRIVLDSHKSNKAANAFYKKYGLTPRTDVPCVRYLADTKLMKILTGPKTYCQSKQTKKLRTV